MAIIRNIYIYNRDKEKKFLNQLLNDTNAILEIAKTLKIDQWIII